MEFRTKIDFKPLENKISHRSVVLSLGSCFAENIAQRMRRAKFNVTSNPFGVLYNPLSIASALERLALPTPVSESELVCCNGLWCNFAFHGSFSSPDRTQAAAAMNSAIESGHRALCAVNTVIITFGTAYIYLHKDEVVANCHKFPASHFTRQRLSVSEIVDAYSRLIENGPLKDKNIIFTVSPVRHVKDGLHENAISKSVLLLAVEELERRYPQVEYFSAFEIVNDDLRDYRFYKKDMLHPNDTAVDYIWERFSEGAFDADTRQLAAQAEKIADAMEHRPFNPDTAQHHAFLASMLAKVSELQHHHPYIDWSPETEFFTR